MADGMFCWLYSSLNVFQRLKLYIFLILSHIKTTHGVCFNARPNLENDRNNSKHQHFERFVGPLSSMNFLHVTEMLVCVWQYKRPTYMYCMLS